MAKIYVALIKKGLKTMEDVPAPLWDQVWRLLNELPDQTDLND